MNILYTNELEKEIKALRHQVATLQMHLDRGKEQEAYLNQKLAEAQAALVLKDDALRWIAGQPAGGAIQCRATEAITIQPDDTALKAWLGEPVGEVETIDIDGDGQPSAWVRLHVDVELGDQLGVSCES